MVGYVKTVRAYICLNPFKKKVLDFVQTIENNMPVIKINSHWQEIRYSLLLNTNIGVGYCLLW